MGEARKFIEQNLRSWNAHDKVSWSRDIADDCDVKGPGGFAGKGRELRDIFYSMWSDAFPNNQIKAITIADEGENAMVEAIFEGTHTGTLKAPSGAIPATGKSVKVPFLTVSKISGGHYKSLHLYFDQVELLMQLGLMPAPAARV